MTSQHLPTLFVPHGSPMFALEPGEAGAALQALPAHLPTPRAIIIVSPHWETGVATVGTSGSPETMHDFGNFDPRLFDMKYPAPGHPGLAREVVNALERAGIPAQEDPNRGLDHGAWVPLRYLYPAADVPVIPLSIQHAGGPQHAFRVGQALATLREQGFLIIGSGNITHNLRDWQRCLMLGLDTPAYVREFADWVNEQLTQRNTDALLNYRKLHPAALQVHPRDEHFLPLFTALGAASAHGTACASGIHRGIRDTVLAMDAYAFSVSELPG